MSCRFPQLLLPGLLFLAICGLSCDDPAKPKPASTANATAIAAPSSSASAAVRFGEPKPAVGDRCKMTHNATINWEHTDPELPGIADKSGGGAEMVLHTEVLAVSSNHEIRWKLTYEKDATFQVRDGKRVRVPSSLEGKTYVAERMGTNTVAITADGSPVSEEEFRSIESAVDGFGELELPDRPLVPGETVPELAKAMAAEEEGIEVTVRFAERKGDSAVFAFKMGREIGGRDAMTMDCRQTVRISDGRTTARTCKSDDMSFSHVDAGKTTSGMKSVMTWDYGKGDRGRSNPPGGTKAKPVGEPAYRLHPYFNSEKPYLTDGGAAPSVRLGVLSFREGAIDEAEVQKIAAKQLSLAERCYWGGLKKSSKLKGRVMVRVQIGVDGRPEVRAGGDLPDEVVVRCTMAALDQTDWPTPKEGTALFFVPIVMTTGS